MRRILFFIFLLAAIPLSSFAQGAPAKYDASWKSLDTRPVPPWFDDAKFGLFVHWSLNSVPEIDAKGM